MRLSPTGPYTRLACVSCALFLCCVLDVHGWQLPTLVGPLRFDWLSAPRRILRLHRDKRTERHGCVGTKEAPFMRGFLERAISFQNLSSFLLNTSKLAWLTGSPPPRTLLRVGSMPHPEEHHNSKHIVHTQVWVLFWRPVTRSLRNDNKNILTIIVAPSKFYCHGVPEKSRDLGGHIFSPPPILPSETQLWFLLSSRRLWVTLIPPQKHRDTNGSRVLIQIGGVYATFTQEEGISSCKSVVIEMGSISRYFSQVSGSGVDLNLLTSHQNYTTVGPCLHILVVKRLKSWLNRGSKAVKKGQQNKWETEPGLNIFRDVAGRSSNSSFHFSFWN